MPSTKAGRTRMRPQKPPPLTGTRAGTEAAFPYTVRFITDTPWAVFLLPNRRPTDYTSNSIPIC